MARESVLLVSHKYSFSIPLIADVLLWDANTKRTINLDTTLK